MTWTKKLLLPSLVVLFSLLLSVFGFGKQASAVNRRVTGITFASVGSYNNISATQVSNWGAFKISCGISQANCPVNNVSNPAQYTVFNDPTYTLNNSLGFGGDTPVLQFDYYLIFQSPNENAYLSAYCPSNAVASGRFPVDSCTIEPVTYERYISDGTIRFPNGVTTSTTNGTMNFNEGITQFYKISYTLSSSSFVTTNSVGITGPIFKVSTPGTGTSDYQYNLYFDFDYAKTVAVVPTAEEQMNSKDDEDRANIEAQTSDTQDGADESSAQAQATGTTLMGAFSAFVTALASVHETNCRLPSITIYGLQLGQMDLCTFDVPSGLVALATIGMVFIIVPMSFHLVRRLINIFRSFSG